MSENEIYDLVIVGGGPGGLSAGIYAMRAALKTVLIEKAFPAVKSTSPTRWKTIPALSTRRGPNFP